MMPEICGKYLTETLISFVSKDNYEELVLTSFFHVYAEMKDDYIKIVDDVVSYMLPGWSAVCIFDGEGMAVRVSSNSSDI